MSCYFKRNFVKAYHYITAQNKQSSCKRYNTLQLFLGEGDISMNYLIFTFKALRV